MFRCSSCGILAVICAFVLAPHSARAAEPAGEQQGLPLVFHEDFSDGDKALAKFEFTDPGSWKIDKDGGRNVLSLFKQCKFKPAVRSPLNRALVKDLYVGPFVMEIKLKSTVKNYPHRDLCLFWGAVDDAHEYYAHLGMAPDPHCFNIFIVNGAPREALLPVPKKGVVWGDDYHTARVTRAADGTMEVTFDGKSILKGNDKALPVGRVGVGSFDDLGNFAEVTLWGQKADKPAPLPPVKATPQAPAKKTKAAK